MHVQPFYPFLDTYQALNRGLVTLSARLMPYCLDKDAIDILWLKYALLPDQAATSRQLAVLRRLHLLLGLLAFAQPRDE